MRALYTIKEGEKTLDIIIIPGRRKSISLSFDNGRGVIKVPYYANEDDVIKLIESHKKWYFEKIKVISEKKLCGPSADQLTREEIDLIIKKFSEKVKYYANIMGVTYGKVTIRNQKTKWGSCSGKGNLNLNYRLYYMPEELMDYVIIHELSHRKFMNHSKDFWNEVSKYCPDYKKLDKDLNNYSL